MKSCAIFLEVMMLSWSLAGEVLDTPAERARAAIAVANAQKQEATPPLPIRPILDYASVRDTAARTGKTLVVIVGNDNPAEMVPEFVYAWVPRGFNGWFDPCQIVSAGVNGELWHSDASTLPLSATAKELKAADIDLRDNVLIGNRRESAQPQTFLFSPARGRGC